MLPVMGVTLKLTVLGILFQISVATFNYHEYSVEDSCMLGNGSVKYDTVKYGSSAVLKATLHPPYRADKDCTIDIIPPENFGIVLSVRKIDLRQRGFFCQDYIKVFHSDPMTSPTMMCRFKFDLKGKISFYSKGPMTIVYHAEAEDYRGFAYEEGFELTYTVVSEDVKYCTQDNIFLCDNGRCLPCDKKCDGQNNCGDRSDEAHVLCDFVDLSMFHAMDISYVMVFSVLVFSIIISCIITRRRRRAQDSTESYSTELPDGNTPLPHPYPSTPKVMQFQGGLPNVYYPPPPPPYSQ